MKGCQGAGEVDDDCEVDLLGTMDRAATLIKQGVTLGIGVMEHFRSSWDAARV